AAAAVILAAVDLAALGPAREQARSDTLEQQHARAPRRLPALLRADDDRAAVVERRQEPARVHLRLRVDAVVVDGAVQLPAVEDQRLALVDAAGHLAVLLHPVRAEEAEGVQRVEVEGEVVSAHQGPPSGGHGRTFAWPVRAWRQSPSRRASRPARPARRAGPSRPGPPSSGRSGRRTGGGCPCRRPSPRRSRRSQTSGPPWRWYCSARTRTAETRRTPGASARPTPTARPRGRRRSPSSPRRAPGSGACPRAPTGRPDAA